MGKRGEIDNEGRDEDDEPGLDVSDSVDSDLGLASKMWTEVLGGDGGVGGKGS